MKHIEIELETNTRQCLNNYNKESSKISTNTACIVLVHCIDIKSILNEKHK